jgi:ABC-type Fe3+-hydroxamate transport system substrate-binding protein
MRFLTLAWLLGAASAFAGVSAVDSDGRRIELVQPAQRIVSLAPHATEQLFAAGAGGKLVAGVRV